jgi:energy-coupling factor transporter transmembrane protein EcfT
MNDFLVGLENTGVSIFIRESSSFLGFPAILTTHAFAYCFIFSTNMIVSARMLGFAKSIPVKPLRRLFPMMWVGLILTTITGLLLTMAAAEKRVPNPILWVKMGFLAIATPMMWKFQMKVFSDPSLTDTNIPPSARTIAVWQIALWILIMISGRLIPYSATILGDGY